MIAEALSQLKTNSLGLRIATTKPQRLAFPHLEYMLKDRQTDLIRDCGLHMLARYAPEATSQLFELAAKDHDITQRDYKRFIGKKYK